MVRTTCTPSADHGLGQTYDLVGAWWRANLHRFPRTSAGWLRTVQEAYGMVGVELPELPLGEGINGYTAREAKGEWQVSTMRTVAHELRCDLVLALVPRRPLQAVLDDQYLSAALAAAGEPDSAPLPVGRAREAMLKAARATIHPGKLWDCGGHRSLTSGLDLSSARPSLDPPDGQYTPEHRKMIREQLTHLAAWWGDVRQEDLLVQDGVLASARKALGMSGPQAARLVRSTYPRFTDLDLRERRGAIGFSALATAAQALDCELVTAFIPRVAMDEVVEGERQRVVSALISLRPGQRDEGVDPREVDDLLWTDFVGTDPIKLLHRTDSRGVRFPVAVRRMPVDLSKVKGEGGARRRVTELIGASEMLDGVSDWWRDRKAILEAPGGDWIEAVRAALGMPRALMHTLAGHGGDAGRPREESVADIRGYARLLNCRMAYAFVPTFSFAAVVVAQTIGRHLVRRKLPLELETLSHEERSLILHEAARAKDDLSIWKVDVGLPPEVPTTPASPARRRVPSLAAARQKVDELAELWSADRPPMALEGRWSRSVRHALGLSNAYMVRARNLAPATTLRREAEELMGSIELGELRRSAATVGCELHWVLVPLAPPASTLDQLRLHTYLRMRGHDPAGEAVRKNRPRLMKQAAQALPDDLLWAQVAANVRSGVGAEELLPWIPALSGTAWEGDVGAPSSWDVHSAGPRVCVDGQYNLPARRALPPLKGVRKETVATAARQLDARPSSANLAASRVRHLRRQLDQTRLWWLENKHHFTAPRDGWIAGIREALCMPYDVATKRAGLTSPIAGREMIEAKGGITLSYYRAIAEGFGCEFVYAVVPRVSLQSMVDRQFLRAYERRTGDTTQRSIPLGSERGELLDRAERLVDELLIWDDEATLPWAFDLGAAAPKRAKSRLPEYPPEERAELRARADALWSTWQAGPPPLVQPPRGWLAAIREALGLTLDQCATLVGRPNGDSLGGLEAAERNGSSTVEPLRRHAASLGCDLILGFVPRRPLQEVVDTERIRQYLRPLGRQAAEAGVPSEIRDQVLAMANQAIPDSGLWKAL